MKLESKETFEITEGREGIPGEELSELRLLGGKELRWKCRGDEAGRERPELRKEHVRTSVEEGMILFEKLEGQGREGEGQEEVWKAGDKQIVTSVLDFHLCVESSSGSHTHGRRDNI